MPLLTHAIWPTLTPTFASEILVTVQKSNKKLYRTAVEVMAPRMGVRVPLLLEMPKAQRHAVWARILSQPQLEVLSFNIFSAWLIEAHKPMLCVWLDALGIPHGDNGCADHFPPEPSPELLREGLEKLLQTYDPSLVAIYLRCFNVIDETGWPALEEILRTDPRLELKPLPVPAEAVTAGE